METTNNGGPLKEDDEEIVPDKEEHIKRPNEYSYRSVFAGIYV